MTKIELIEDSSKELRNNWLRKSSHFIDQIRKREMDLARLKQSNAKDSIINRVDHEIEVMITFYNHTEEIINSFSLQSIALRTQIMLLKMENKELGNWLIEITKENSEQTEKLIQLLSKGQNI